MKILKHVRPKKKHYRIQVFVQLPYFYIVPMYPTAKIDTFFLLSNIIDFVSTLIANYKRLLANELV